MLHLAHVQTTDAGGKTALQLLAQQTSEYSWRVLPVPEIVLAVINNYQEGTLILVELSDAGEVLSAEAATAWVLNLIEQYLSSGITPALLEQEAQRAEQWRQSLTLQSQEMGRRSLEMEARRDQIQDLEENLKKEKKQLELMAAETEARWSKIQDAEELLKHERKQLQELEEHLRRERKQLDALATELSLKTNSKRSAT
jgi:chromosome segregation ATPase